MCAATPAPRSRFRNSYVPPARRGSRTVVAGGAPERSLGPTWTAASNPCDLHSLRVAVHACQLALRRVEQRARTFHHPSRPNHSFVAAAAGRRARRVAAPRFSFASLTPGCVEGVTASNFVLTSRIESDHAARARRRGHSFEFRFHESDGAVRVRRRGHSFDFRFHESDGAVRARELRARGNVTRSSRTLCRVVCRASAGSGVPPLQSKAKLRRAIGVGRVAESY